MSIVVRGEGPKKIKYQYEINDLMTRVRGLETDNRQFWVLEGTDTSKFYDGEDELVEAVRYLNGQVKDLKSHIRHLRKDNKWQTFTSQQSNRCLSGLNGSTSKLTGSRWLPRRSSRGSCTD